MKKPICIIFTMLICVSCKSISYSNRTLALQKSSPVPVNDCLPVNKDKPTEKLSHDNDDLYSPLNYDQQQAVWISYIDLQPMLLNQSEEQFAENISSAYEKIKNAGCNTVYVHIRSFGDAYYESKLFPWSKNISGEIGNAPDFEPLTIMIEKAHENALSFHAWINPMRCETEDNMQKIQESYIIKKWYSYPEEYDEYLVKPENDNHYWLNPAIDEVRQLIADGVKEIAENYDVDGIHIDDYFYPTTDIYFDSGTYVETGVTKSLSDWRLDNVSQMVRDMYNAVKSVNEDILFGVSPQGNIENNYEYMYADVKKWCSEQGYLDYIVPQIYFGFENTSKPFEQTAEEWSNIVTNENIRLIIGLGVYKINEEEEFIKTTGIIGEQIGISQKLSNYNGVALYNYVNLFEPTKAQARRANAELECIRKALINN